LRLISLSRSHKEHDSSLDKLFANEGTCTTIGEKLAMKPLPPPDVPGKTEFQRFDNAVRQVLTVSKEELLKREEREKQKREKANAKRK
jgi:hypothetical protein